MPRDSNEYSSAVDLERGADQQCTTVMVVNRSAIGFGVVDCDRRQFPPKQPPPNPPSHDVNNVLPKHPSPRPVRDECCRRSTDFD